jgi:hypothetical protein
VSILALDKYPRILDFLDHIPEWASAGLSLAAGIMLIPGLIVGFVFGHGVHDPSVPGMVAGSFVFYYCAGYYGLQLRARWKATAVPNGGIASQGRASD